MINAKLIQVVMLSIASAAAWPTWAHNPQHHGKHAAEPKFEQKDWGIGAPPSKATRTIEVRMTDNMRFTPNQIEVKLGETVRFVLVNSGKLMHEFILGTRKELDEHAALMKKFPNMEHDEPHMAHVEQGKKGELVWTFNRAGEFDFACLLPGHYEAGMRGVVKVVSATAAAQNGLIAALPQPSMDHSKTGHDHSETIQSSPAMSDGEVRKVDLETGKVTIRHGYIKHLDMPSMTMVFTVKDKGLLHAVKPGDKVQFMVVEQAGKMVITAITPVH